MNFFRMLYLTVWFPKIFINWIPVILAEFQFDSLGVLNSALDHVENIVEKLKQSHSSFRFWRMSYF